ncbi:MAG: isocitrate/isopropylmalate dehydrogenase family protein [Blastocatellia bacterium]|jgi:isocitrate dehydrogenase (NAD+)|nr:isocitrate/isopropylmalate dehydrogenase family protein [Blastocatellia bacterium]
MAHVVTLIPGDGIGPEVTKSVVEILESTGVAFEWERVEAGAAVFDRTGEALSIEVIEACKKNGVALKGPIGTPIAKGFQSVNVRLRKILDLYSNFRPVRSLPGVETHFGPLDFVIVRENTEGLYAGLEHEIVPGVVTSLKVVSERASLRIARWAFEYARRAGRKRITCVHKANIMKMSDGLFLKCFRDVAVNYPDIVADERIVDALCMNLVMNPGQFDVLLLENLYGDIVSDLGAGLVGGLGMVPGANIGDDCAVFEAVHGSAPDIAGKNVANPIALLRSAILMLEHLGESDAARRVDTALAQTLSWTPIRTRDLGGNSTTTEFTAAVCEAIQKGPSLSA